MWPFARRETQDGQVVITPLSPTPGMPSGSSGFVASRPNSQQETHPSDTTEDLQYQDLSGNWFNSQAKNCSLQPPRSLSFDSLMPPSSYNHLLPEDAPLCPDRPTGFNRNSSTPILSNTNNGQATDIANMRGTPESSARSLPQPSHQLQDLPADDALRRSKSTKNTQGKNKLHRKQVPGSSSGTRSRAINNPKRTHPGTKGDPPATSSDDSATKREASTFKINALNALFPHPQLVYQNQRDVSDIPNSKSRSKDKSQKSLGGKENKAPLPESHPKPQSSQSHQQGGKQRPTTRAAKSRHGKDLPDTMSAATLRELLEKDQRRRETRRQNAVPKAGSKSSLKHQKPDAAYRGNTPEPRGRSAAGANVGGMPDAAKRKKFASSNPQVDDHVRNKRSARDARNTQSSEEEATPNRDNANAPRRANRERRATVVSANPAYATTNDNTAPMTIKPVGGLSSFLRRGSRLGKPPTNAPESGVLNAQGTPEFLVPSRELHMKQNPTRPSSASSPFMDKSSPYSGLSLSKSAGQINETPYEGDTSERDQLYSPLIPPNDQTRIPSAGRDSDFSSSTPLASPDLDDSHAQAFSRDRTPTAIDSAAMGDDGDARHGAPVKSPMQEHFNTFFNCDDDTSILSRQDSITSSFYSEADDVDLSHGDANDSKVSVTVRPGAGRKGHVVRTLEVDGILSNAVEPELETGDEHDEYPLDSHSPLNGR